MKNLILKFGILFLLPYTISGVTLADDLASKNPQLSFECRAALDRINRAMLRAERSLERSRTSLLRIHYELKRVGHATEMSLEMLEEVLPNSQDTPPNQISSVADKIWDIEELAAAFKVKAERAMSRFRARPMPSFVFGTHVPDLNERALARPESTGLEVCVPWAEYAALGAFRSEQSAQLTAVAAEQAITLSDYAHKK